MDGEKRGLGDQGEPAFGNRGRGDRRLDAKVLESRTDRDSGEETKLVKESRSSFSLGVLWNNGGLT